MSHSLLICEMEEKRRRLKVLNGFVHGQTNKNVVGVGHKFDLFYNCLLNLFNVGNKLMIFFKGH